MNKQEIEIVKKNTCEFKTAQKQYIDLFVSAKESEYLQRFQQHDGRCLGFTTQKILDANLPNPFGCPSLFIMPCIENGKGVGVIWLCDRVGCICACCREDMKEEYPDYCPSGVDAVSEDCAFHQHDCDGCPSRHICYPTLDDFDEPLKEYYG